MSKSESRALHEELMSCKLRTAETDTTNKQLRLRVMELETSGQITANQVGSSCVVNAVLFMFLLFGAVGTAYQQSHSFRLSC